MYGGDPTSYQEMIQGLVKYGYDEEYVLGHPPYYVEFIIWELLLEEAKRKNEQLKSLQHRH